MLHQLLQHQLTQRLLVSVVKVIYAWGVHTVAIQTISRQDNHAILAFTALKGHLIKFNALLVPIMLN